MSLSGFVIRIIVALQNEFGSVPTFSIFHNSLRRGNALPYIFSGFPCEADSAWSSVCQVGFFFFFFFFFNFRFNFTSSNWSVHSNWSVLVIGLSIFSQFSIGSLYVSISLSISSILSNLLVYNMIFLISLWYLLTFFSLFLVLFVSFLLDESS